MSRSIKTHQIATKREVAVGIDAIRRNAPLQSL
jgi:hypothetical protein